MEKEKSVVPLPWSATDERRLRRLVAAMLPIDHILAEFPDHDANAVRGALSMIFTYVAHPAERAVQVLGGRARVTRRSPTGFCLDGRPSSVALLVAAANEILVAFDEPAIPYPGGR
ncbi:MAG: hypothetical protein F8N39_11565 [Clostridiaceae bacterium]|nr:hypothetical protein [Clostridiaceae bacterium]